MMTLPSKIRCSTRLRLAAICLAALPAAASAADIWVVTDQSHPVIHVQGARLIELDAPKRIEAALSADLPPDPTRASALVRERLQDGRGDLQRRLAIAYRGVVDAWQLGVTHVPAVIVGQRYIVYGEPDVERAVSLIEDYRRTHP